MKNFTTFADYERLHDIFEKVHPKDLPGVFDEVMEFMKEGLIFQNDKTGDRLHVSEYTGILEDLKDVFTRSLHLTDKSVKVLLCSATKDYEIDLHPICEYMLHNDSVLDDLDILKMHLVTLANETNTESLKKNYQFIDSLSIVLAG